jgi:tetratricopeptide (TPR) repeat protein
MALSLLPAPAPPAPPTKEVEIQVSAPPGDRTLFREARRSLNSRNFAKAQETYLRALKANPADSFADNDLGVVYFMQNRFQDAEAAFRRSVALDPFLSEARYNLGLVLQRLGRRSEALEQFRVGLQGASRNTTANFQDALHGRLHDPMTSPQ